MDYTESGFNQFLQRTYLPVNTVASEDTFSAYTTEVPGVGTGRSVSADGRMIIDWGNGNFSSSDGTRVRVIVGYIPEEKKYGIKILDNAGNVVFSVAGQASSLADNSVTTDSITNSAVTDAKISSLSVSKLLAGDLIVAMDVGDPATGYVRVDGENNYILVNDGTNNRIVIGDV